MVALKKHKKKKWSLFGEIKALPEPEGKEPLPEVKKPITPSKPEDLPYDKVNPLPPVVPQGFHASQTPAAPLLKPVLLSKPVQPPEPTKTSKAPEPAKDINASFQGKDPGAIYKALKKIDVHTLPTWKKNQHGRSYGAVIVNNKGEILIRKPANFFESLSWSLAKGGPDPGEHPVDSALREAFEETGHTGEVLGLVPGDFSAATGRQNFYFLVRPTDYDPEAWKQNGETDEIKWVTPEKAIEMFKTGKNPKKIERDIDVVKAAMQEYNRMYGGK